MNKSEILNNLSLEGRNVAQFISLNEKDKVEFVHIRDRETQSDRLEPLIKELIEKAFSKCVNIRTFKEGSTKSNNFHFAKTNVKEIISIINEEISQGFFVIVNENIDTHDGGVSGVILNGRIEFSPQDTPRCVEKEGVCSLPLNIGNKMLKSIYDIDVASYLDSIGVDHRNTRVEFSIHPIKQGVHQERVIIWELEKVEEQEEINKIHTFPNRFSKFLGEKAYGLVLAEALGIKIPKSIIISKEVSPFILGENIEGSEKWLRTAPRIKMGGYFETIKGYENVFSFLQTEEEKMEGGDNLGSIISQDGVNALYSGACLVNKDKIIIEGTNGEGDKFMVGEHDNDLPQRIKDIVTNYINSLSQLRKLLKSFTFEWVYDGEEVWLVQLNQNTIESTSTSIVPFVVGEIDDWIEFDVQDGLESLRTIIDTLGHPDIDNGKQTIGIKVLGDVGITSHIGDVLRANKIPSYIVKKEK